MVNPVGVEPDCPVCGEPWAYARPAGDRRRREAPRVYCPRGHSYEVTHTFRQGEGRPLLLGLGMRVDILLGGPR